MKLNKNISSAISPQMLITNINVFIPINIRESVSVQDDIEYKEYIYDEEEYTTQEYILKLSSQVDNLNNVTDYLILEGLK